MTPSRPHPHRHHLDPDKRPSSVDNDPPPGIRDALLKFYAGDCMFCIGTGRHAVSLISHNSSSEHERSWLVSLTRNMDGPWDIGKINCFSLTCDHHAIDLSEHTFALVPSEEDLNMLISFEIADYKDRFSALKRGAKHFPCRNLPAPERFSHWVEVLLVDPEVDGHLGLFHWTVNNCLQWVRQYPSLSGSTNCRWRRKLASDTYEFNSGDIVLNPWSLIVRALHVLGDGFHPRSARTLVVHAKLLKLRDLYNRPFPDALEP